MQKQILKIFFSLLIFLMTPDFTRADWQQILESNFDIVETFDNLQDWSANGLYPSSADDVRAYDRELLPKKNDGNYSRWRYWANKYPTPIVETINNGPFQVGETVTNDLGANWEYRQTYVLVGITYLRLGDAIYGQSVGSFHVGDMLRGLSSGATATITAWPKIIADHGENKWGLAGKSLMMNLGDNDNSAGAMGGIGAQRLGLFFGDGISGKSGFKKVHVFMMVKFSPTYFGATGAESDIDYISVFKFFDICSGFTAINKFGTDSEQIRIEQTSQTKTEYGANVSVMNINGGGLSTAGRVFLTENIGNATLTPDSNPQTFYEKIQTISNLFNNDPNFNADGTEMNKIYDNGFSAGEWFGMEIVSDIGTTNNSDGTTDLYI